MPATSAFLKLTAQKIGEIKGPVRLPERENAIKLIAVKHEIISPRDAAGGLPSGKRQHHPITITKEVDNTTPLLNKLLVENLPISQATFLFFGTDPLKSVGANIDSEVYRIVLKNASVSRIEVIMSDTSLIESVSFTYSEIEWTWKNGKISMQDKWSAGV